MTSKALYRDLTVYQNFRSALDARYMTVKIRAAPDWIDQTESMRSVLEAYPVPVEA